MPQRKSLLIAMICLPVLDGYSALVHGVPFGAPDSRSAAMGKTGVASVDSTNSAYFNPALLAAFLKRKHVGQNQRIAVPSLTAFVSDSVRRVVDIDNAEYDKQLENVIVDFNNNINIDSFVATLDSLDEDLNQASAGPLLADAQLNVVLRIPDRHAGGAFYYGYRAVMDGNLDYTEADAALLAAYLEEARFVANGGAPATLHPELYMNGQLVNPSNNLTSTVDAAALIIEELAFSMGWSVTWWGADMMIGLTPKVMHVTTYEYAATATSGDLTRKGEYENDANLNLDLGWAKQMDDQLTIGLSIKNLFPQEYRTESDRYVKLRPQARIGAAYLTKWGNYAIDLDVLESAPLSSGDPTRELGIGGEWSIRQHLLRAGVVANLAATGKNRSPLYTFGVRLNLGSFYSDLTYGRADNQESAALQVGLRF